ncbi:hypothetical protein [Halorubrum amylolyticum]|uniref:hypothetical protein n=1 Tax=Halorubrum amylolyticum TaxID=2508724 RepID=UPI001008F0CF|nr:hypothetical protein [Halorubrum amylolyticum]
MALQLSHAVSDGIRRTLTRTGGLLLVGLFAIQIGLQVSVNSALLGFLPPEIAEQFRSNTGLALPISGRVGLALFVVLTVLSSTYFVILSRTLAQPRSEMSTFPAAVTRRLGRATGIALVGGLIVSVSILIGTILLLFPGLFLAASFLFFIFAVAVEDLGLVGSLQRSWALARGSRLKLGLLVVASALFGGFIGAVGPLLDLAGASVAADVVTSALTAVFFLPYYAIIASAYRQLRDEQTGPGGSTSGTADATRVPEL